MLQKSGYAHELTKKLIDCLKSALTYQLYFYYLNMASKPGASEIFVPFGHQSAHKFPFLSRIPICTSSVILRSFPSIVSRKLSFILMSSSPGLLAYSILCTYLPINNASFSVPNKVSFAQNHCVFA